MILKNELVYSIYLAKGLRKNLKFCMKWGTFFQHMCWKTLNYKVLRKLTSKP